MEASNDPPGPGNTEPEESSAKPIHVSYYMNNGVLSVREKDLKDVYELKEEISRGDFGPVFKVVQRTTGQAAEAKFKQLPRFVRRQEALREIEMLFLFTPHPNLLLLHDAFQMLDSKEIVLITEPLQGCSLFEWLVSSRGRVTERVCAGYLRKLCSALNHLHAASIMHLDLKLFPGLWREQPESLQLACGDELKLTGFSVARRCGEEPSLLRGDAEFSAPEQLGSEAATINTDMWPVGLLAIIVLSGVSPFWASTKEEMVQKVISATWAFPDSFSSISKGAKDFISKLVKKSPETRMSAALCLEHAWLDGTAADKPLSTATLKEFWGRYKSEKPASYVHCFPKSAKAKQSEEKE